MVCCFVDVSSSAECQVQRLVATPQPLPDEVTTSPAIPNPRNASRPSSLPFARSTLDHGCNRAAYPPRPLRLGAFPLKLLSPGLVCPPPPWALPKCPPDARCRAGCDRGASLVQPSTGDARRRRGSEGRGQGGRERGKKRSVLYDESSRDDG